MKAQIFREKSMERVSSPEQLNDYIRVANPGVWLALAAIIFLLIGVCVWGVFGRLDTTLTVGAITEEGQTICYVKDADIGGVSTGMTVLLDDTELRIRSIAVQPELVDEEFPEYLAHLGGIAEGEWVYVVELDGTAGENGGIYEANIVVERVSPISFVID